MKIEFIIILIVFNDYYFEKFTVEDYLVEIFKKSNTDRVNLTLIVVQK